jgi:hypothetical protein
VSIFVFAPSHHATQENVEKSFVCESCLICRLENWSNGIDLRFLGGMQSMAHLFYLRKATKGWKSCNLVQSFEYR